MTSFNISGLVSGIDTSSLIDQLMTVASAPQTALQNQVATDQSQISAYQAVNTKLAAVQTAAQALASSDTWNATTATSSDPSVVATGSTSAQPGLSTTFSVTKLASAQITTVATGGADVADPNAGIDVVDSSGATHHLALTDGSATSVASAVNAAGLGVRAALINSDAGPVLQFTSTTTGSSAAFTVYGLTQATQNLATAQNAQVTVGDPASGGYTVSSSTNTFTNAIPGVTFTVSALASDVSIGVTSNESSISSSAQALVTAVNAALGEISQDTAQGAVLAGDGTLEALQQKLLGVVAAGTGSGGSLATYGVGLTSTGALTFDAGAFAAAYSADPTGTRTAVSAFSNSVNGVSTAATDPTSGSVTQLINSEKSAVSSLNDQIATWTTRLADQKAALQAKYAAMEAALSKMKSESSYLSSMFNQQSSNSSSGSSSSSSSN